jgi:hypothetical protein
MAGGAPGAWAFATPSVIRQTPKSAAAAAIAPTPYTTRNRII